MATRISPRLDPRSAADLQLIRRETAASSISDALTYSLREVAERLRCEAGTSGLVMRAFLDADLRSEHDLG